MRPITKTLLVVAVIGGGYYAWTHFMPHGGMPGGMPPHGAPPVSVAEVIERDVHQWNEFSGRLVAVDQAEIRPQVSGIIDSVHFENGEQVKKGELLFIIDPRPYEAAMQAAKAKALLAEAEMQRAESLLKDKAISQRDYDQRKSALAAARADLTQATLNLNYTQVKAPIAGQVGRAEITAGNLVEAGGNAPVLTTVVSNAPIYADFTVDEPTYLQYTKGDISAESAQQIPVQLQLDEASAPRTGHVESFDNHLDTASGTIRVRAVFANEDHTLVPGLFARIKLGSTQTTKAILITDRAIGTDQSKKFVIVVGEDGKTEHREIKIDGLAEGLRVVLEGLKPGEKIIVSGLQRVMMPGQPVTPEMVPMDGPATPPAAPPAADKEATGKDTKAP